MKCNASYFSVETLSMADNNTQPQRSSLRALTEARMQKYKSLA